MNRRLKKASVLAITMCAITLLSGCGMSLFGKTTANYDKKAKRIELNYADFDTKKDGLYLPVGKNKLTPLFYATPVQGQSDTSDKSEYLILQTPIELIEKHFLVEDFIPKLKKTDTIYAYVTTTEKKQEGITFTKLDKEGYSLGLKVSTNLDKNNVLVFSKGSFISESDFAREASKTPMANGKEHELLSINGNTLPADYINFKTGTFKGLERNKLYEIKSQAGSVSTKTTARAES